MSIIITGEKGTPLKDIINNLGNRIYNSVIFRCKWDENGEQFDEFFGMCQYAPATGLSPLDHDSYSLNDLFMEYEEVVNPDGSYSLIVWEYGEIKKEA